MKNAYNKQVIIFLLILMLIISITGFFYISGLNNKNNITQENLTNTGINDTFSGKTNTGFINTKDEKIVEISDYGNLDLALKLNLERFKINKGEDIGDYDQLMWIYIDKGDYNEVIRLGKIAEGILEKNNILEEKGIKGIRYGIIGQMAQAYLYSGKIKEAEDIMKKYNDLEFIFEKIVLEYKKGNYDYIIKNYESIKRETPDFIGMSLDLLAKSYIEKNDINNAIKIYEEIFDFGNEVETGDIIRDGKILEHKNVVMGITFIYMSSDNLKKIYLSQGNTEKSDFYNNIFLTYKNRIDTEEKIQGTDEKINKNYIYFVIDRHNDL